MIGNTLQFNRLPSRRNEMTGERGKKIKRVRINYIGILAVKEKKNSIRSFLFFTLIFMQRIKSGSLSFGSEGKRTPRVQEHTMIVYTSIVKKLNCALFLFKNSLISGVEIDNFYVEGSLFNFFFLMKLCMDAYRNTRVRFLEN
eukprot:gene5179-3726_t